jgi:hypothetical protein
MAPHDESGFSQENDARVIFSDEPRLTDYGVVIPA